MKRLILIHGRSQQNFDPSTIKSEWLDSLDNGLRAIHLTLPGVESVSFPYYGDSLAQLSIGLSAEQAATIALRGNAVDVEEEDLFREVISMTASNDGFGGSVW